MNGLRQALLLATGERYVGLVLNFATMAAVSRILTPAEVGVAVIGWALLSIPFALRDLGTMDFIIQRKVLSQDETRTAATIGLISSAALVGLIAAGTPLIVAAYGDERIGRFVSVLMLAIITDAVACPIVALMRRDMDFQRVVCVNLTLSTVSSTMTIVLALLGFSYMCVAWAGLISNVLAATLALVLRPHLWVFRPCVRRWREVLGFGVYFSSMAVLVRAYEAMPFLALGRFMQATAAGYYSRAFQVCQLPDKLILSGIVAIAFPALAAEAREGRMLKTSYLRAIEHITAVQWPGLILLCLIAPRVVSVLFGEQWGEVTPLVQIMALASLFGVASALTYPILYAMGNLRHALAATLLSLPVSALIMVSSATQGATALALSLFITIPLNNIVALEFIRRHLRFGWIEVWDAVRKSVAVTLLSVAGPLCMLAALGFHFDQPIWAQGMMLVLAAAGWGAGLRLAAHPLLDELVHAWRAVRLSLGGGSHPALNPEGPTR